MRDELADRSIFHQGNSRTHLSRDFKGREIINSERRRKEKCSKIIVQRNANGKNGHFSDNVVRMR